MTAKPRPQDDEALGEICRWLRAKKLVMLVSISGNAIIQKAESVYGPEGSPYDKFRPIDDPKEA